MATVELTDEMFEQEVVQSDLPVVVDFAAAWCGPCKQLEPILNELANDYAGKLKICRLDVDQARDTAIRFGVSSLPTIMFFKGGAPTESLVGFQPKPKLVAKLNDFLSDAT